jgi:hypothetical protein
LGLLFSLSRVTYGAVGPESGVQPIVAAFHVHSTASTGGLTLDQLAARAEQLGLDAIILSDNFSLRFEYGLFPLRGVLRHVVSIPSVNGAGVKSFLTAVAEAQARHPQVLLVPGFEVTPYYHWTGSLPGQDLTLHDSQKNLLVLGLPQAEDYAALPVTSNPASYRYEAATLLNLTPVALTVPAVWLWRRRSARSTRIGMVTYTTRRRRPVLAIVFLALAGGLLVNAWPFGQPVFSAYQEGLGYQPYQAFIDAVTARGGVAIWSMPEARDFNVYSFGLLGKVTVKTDPYPEALAFTRQYTGFGGVYQDNHTVTQPGGIWDQVLGLYVAGQRGRPPFVFGEIAFHGPGHDRLELSQIVNVLWVRERTVDSVIEAIRTGRLYPVSQPHKEFGLRLDRFRVECEGGARGADSGETLDPEGARDLTVRVAVSTLDQGRHQIAVSIVRSGQIIARTTGETPFEQDFLDARVPAGEWGIYRVEVRGDGEILSNPIFVGPVPEARAVER